MFDIDHISRLAKIKLSQKEKKELEKEFSLILKFVEKIKEVKIKKDVKPLRHIAPLKNVLREDKPKEFKKRKPLFPKEKKKEDFFKTKPVF